MHNQFSPTFPSIIVPCDSKMIPPARTWAPDARSRMEEREVQVRRKQEPKRRRHRFRRTSPQTLRPHLTRPPPRKSPSRPKIPWLERSTPLPRAPRLLTPQALLRARPHRLSSAATRAACRHPFDEWLSTAPEASTSIKI